MKTHPSKRLLLVGIIPLVYQVIFTIFGYAFPVTIIPPSGWLALHGLTDVLFIVCPLVAIGLPITTAWKAIGGWRVSWTDGTIAVIGGGVSILLFQATYSAILSLVFHIVPDFGFSQSAQDIEAFIFWVILLGPLGEEIYFRGFLNHIFPKVWQYIIVSSLLWAGLHVDIINFIPLLFMGIILALTRVKTHSFYPALIIHILINIVALLFHFL